MRLQSILLLIRYLLHLASSAPALPQDLSEPPYYRKLVEYAKLASIAYCLDRGLTEGELGSPAAGCSLPLCQEPEFKNIQILKLFDSNEWGQVGAGFYALDHTTKRILLVFRGTATRRDYLSDFDFFPVPYSPLAALSQQNIGECKGCKAHRGFYKFLRRNCDKILNSLNTLVQQHQDYKLVIVGHSLGAALAIMTGVEFQLMGHNPLIISYAGPKIGNQNYVEYVNDLFDIKGVANAIRGHDDFDRGIIRVTHKGDLVPTLPPSPLFQVEGFEFLIEKREVPHLPADVTLRGSHSEDLSASFIGDKTPAAVWSSLIRSYEHANYFVKITGCGQV